jgi:hypothetical protein
LPVHAAPLEELLEVPPLDDEPPLEELLAPPDELLPPDDVLPPPDDVLPPPLDPPELEELDGPELEDEHAITKIPARVRDRARRGRSRVDSIAIVWSQPVQIMGTRINQGSEDARRATLPHKTRAANDGARHASVIPVQSMAVRARGTL